MYVAGLPQDSFIAFLVLDPVGLRPYKQFFREQKLVDLIRSGRMRMVWGRMAQFWPNKPTGCQEEPPTGGAEKLYDPGKSNEALMNKNSWTFIKNPKFYWIYFPWPPLIFGVHSNLPVTVYSGFVRPTYRGFAVSEVMDLCVTRRRAGSGGLEGEAMVWKILEINSLCGNQRRFLPFGKSGSWNINRGLLPSSFCLLAKLQIFLLNRFLAR